MRFRLPRQQGRAPLSTCALPHASTPLKPKLRVYRALSGRCWYWDLDHGDGDGHGSSAPTHAAALALGLAEMETLYLRQRSA